jgi:hypothetical protein
MRNVKSTEKTIDALHALPALIWCPDTLMPKKEGIVGFISFQRHN